MGLVKSLIFEGIKLNRLKAAAAGKGTAGHTMQHLGKSAVTRSDVERVSQHVEQVRDDIHKGMSDLYSHATANNELFSHHLMKLQNQVNQHGEMIKELVDVIKNVHGMG